MKIRAHSLCTIFVFITAAMSVGFLGAKNSKAANAYTADNKSNFVQVYDGKDIFDASSGSFRIDGMEALFNFFFHIFIHLFYKVIPTRMLRSKKIRCSAENSSLSMLLWGFGD